MMPSAPATLKKTPLNARHRSHGARMVEFGGWDMPVEYSGITEEHLAVRSAAGLFDVSHMGQIEIAGADALKAIQWLTSNDASNSLGGPEQLTTINGSTRAQMGSVNFQLDGGNNTAGLRGTGNPAPNPEAVQEFRVLTNGYAAEYGRYAAGGVDVVTK